MLDPERLREVLEDPGLYRFYSRFAMCNVVMAKFNPGYPHTAGALYPDGRKLWSYVELFCLHGERLVYVYDLSLDKILRFNPIVAERLAREGVIAPVPEEEKK